MAKGLNKDYAGRPSWQIVIIYLIIGLLVYGGIYFLFIAKKSSYSIDNTYQNVMPTQSPPSDSSY